MNKFHKNGLILLLCVMIALTTCSRAPAQADPPVQGEEITVEPAGDSDVVSDVDPAPTSTVMPSQVEVDLPEGIELEFWHTWAGNQAEVFENLVEVFNQTNQWGIRVAAQGHGDELVLLDEIQQAWEAQSFPDIVAAPSRHLRLWDQQGVPIHDLNEYTASGNVGLDQEALNSFLPVFWKTDVNEDGKRLGVPAYRSGSFLFYNQSWARDLGFETYPQTLTAFTEQACAAGSANLSDAAVENNGTGGWIYDIQAVTGYSWLKAFTGDALVVEDDAVSFEEEGSQTALETIYDWYAQDCAWTGRQSEPYEYFAKRYALFYSGSNEDIFIQEAANADANNNDEWLMIPYPSDDQRPVVVVDGVSFALLGEDEEKALAGWLFLRFMLAEENQVKIVEETASLPLSNAAIGLLGDFRSAHPAWDQSLQYLALAQSMPLSPEWIAIEPVFSDIIWQLRFSLSKENIPEILREADAIVQEINVDQQ